MCDMTYFPYITCYIISRYSIFHRIYNKLCALSPRTRHRPVQAPVNGPKADSRQRYPTTSETS